MEIRMATTIRTGAAEDRPQKLTQNGALRRAWCWYLSLLFFPFPIFLAICFTRNGELVLHPSAAIGNAWFIGAIAYLIIAAPIAFALRSRLFRSYWRGSGSRRLSCGNADRLGHI
jgi:hypothetical protein